MYKEHWVPDWTVINCCECQEQFTFSRRRHHCRRCGEIFCSTCCPSSSRVPLDPSNAELDNFGVMSRVCTACYAEASHKMRSKAYNSRKEDLVAAVKRLEFELQRSSERAESAELKLNELQGEQGLIEQLRDTQEELEGYKAMADGAEADMLSISSDLQGTMNILSSAVFQGEVFKRKTRPDGSHTNWERRWLCLSKSGLAYYKMEEAQHAFPLKDIVGAAFSTAQKDKSAEGQTQAIQMVVKNGSRFDFILSGAADPPPHSDEESTSKSADLNKVYIAPSDWLEMYDILKRGMPSQQRSALVKKNGWLQKMPISHAGRWTLRWFVLQAGSLFYFESDKHDSPKNVYPLHSAQIQVTTIPGRSPWCMQLTLSKDVNGGESFALEAGGPDEMGEWLDAIRAASKFKTGSAGSAPRPIDQPTSALRTGEGTPPGLLTRMTTIANPPSPGIHVGGGVNLAQPDMTGSMVTISGYLNKKPPGMGRWVRRWFALKAGLLSYHTSENVECIDSFVLYGSEVGRADDELPTHPHCFYITPPSKKGRKYILQAETEEHMTTWINCLKTCSQA